MLILLLNSCFCSIWTCISNLFLSHAVLFLLHNSFRESLFPQACPYPWIRYLLFQSLCWIHLHKTSSSPSSIVIILAHTWSLQSLLPQSTIIINLLYQCHSLIVIIFQVEVQVRHCRVYMDQASVLIILLYYFGGQYILFYKLHIQSDPLNVYKLTALAIIGIWVLSDSAPHIIQAPMFSFRCYVCLFSNLIRNSIRVMCYSSGCLWPSTKPSSSYLLLIYPLLLVYWR